MTTAKDPFESYLTRAAELFEAGDIVQAGQIWQAILKKSPNHETARAGLYKVKLYFDARATQDGLAGAKPAPAPLPKPVLNPEVDRLLEQGCTLYDAGHVEDALNRWEQVLGIEPENALAKGYITGARRTMESAPQMNPCETGSLPVPAAEADPAPSPEPESAPPSAPTEPEIDIEKCLRDGCTLYDMGQTEDALRKWEMVLGADPGHVLARSYVKGARKDLGLPDLEEGGAPLSAAPAEEAAPAPKAFVHADSEVLDRIIREGVQLYDMGMNEEACDKWRQVLETVPDHADALGYLAMADRDARASAPSSAPRPAAPTPPPPPIHAAPVALEFAPSGFAAPAPIALSLPDPGPATPEPDADPSEQAPHQAAAVPAAVVTPSHSAPRKGLELPQQLQSLSIPAWLASPKLILGLIVGFVLLIAGSTIYHQWRKEVRLKEAIESFRQEALAPVARSIQIPSLGENPSAILKEGQQALGDEPLTAYYRAQEALRLNPTNPAAAELMEKAKAELATVAASAANLADYQRQIQEGDLDSAQHTIKRLLAQTPDDALLKERAARLYRALSCIHANKERWQEAGDCLRQGRAMFPTDTSWNARLKLLENVQSMGRADRAPWIQLLG